MGRLEHIDLDKILSYESPRDLLEKSIPFVIDKVENYIVCRFLDQYIVYPQIPVTYTIFV